MVRTRDEDEYEVDKIVDVKADEHTRAPLFKVRWKGYSKSHDTWEPVDHLLNVLGLCNVYLLNKGYAPLHQNGSGKLVRKEEDVGENSEEQEEEEPKPKKKAKKEGPYTPIIKSPKPLKTPAKEVRTPNAKQAKAEGNIPGKPAAVPKPSAAHKSPMRSPSNSSPLPPISPDRPPTRPPNRPISSPVPRPSRSDLPSVPTQRSAVPNPPSESFSSNAPENSPLQGLRVRRADWEFDRPLQILGCRVGESGLEYSILFAFDTGVVPLPKIVSHEELITKAPWLFARFFITNHKVFIPS